MIQVVNKLRVPLKYYQQNELKISKVKVYHILEAHFNLKNTVEEKYKITLKVNK